MSEWQVTKLGSLGKVVTGKTPSKDNPEDWGSEVLFITPSDYKYYGKYANSSIRMLSSIGAKRQDNRLLPKSSILVTCIGSDMGKTAINSEACVTNQQINAIIPNKTANPDFIYYLTKELYETLSSLGSDGTAVPILNKSDFENIDIAIPNLEEQKAIASVLSSLDDKIDLLHRQNTTLERMAETLFRQWFIEEAQEDWELRKLGDCVTISYGKNLPTKNLLDDGYPVFGANGQIGFYNHYTYEESQVLVSCRGEASGKVNISLPKSYVTNNSLALERNKRPEISFEFLKYWALFYDFNLHVSGSAQPQITIDGLYGADFTIPPKEFIGNFSLITRSLETKKLNNFYQIQTLEKLRDTLLPKLMSGEVRVTLNGEHHDAI